jgi:uncharacterized membrane protein (DUF106 family)
LSTLAILPVVGQPLLQNIKHHIKHQTSNIKHQTSNIKHQTSNIKHQTSHPMHLADAASILCYAWLTAVYTAFTIISFTKLNPAPFKQ